MRPKKNPSANSSTGEEVDREWREGSQSESEGETQTCEIQTKLLLNFL
jgi:hypothetical protein